jgi:hypothetical protein
VLAHLLGGLNLAPGGREQAHGMAGLLRGASQDGRAAVALRVQGRGGPPGPEGGAGGWSAATYLDMTLCQRP